VHQIGQLPRMEKYFYTMASIFRKNSNICKK